MTLISFERSGGLVSNEIRLNLNLNELPADESQYLHKLLFEADFFKIPQDLTGNSTSDEFQYIITVEAGNSSHTIRATDTTMPNALVPLVQELTVMQAAP